MVDESQSRLRQVLEPRKSIWTANVMMLGVPVLASIIVGWNYALVFETRERFVVESSTAGPLQDMVVNWLFVPIAAPVAEVVYSNEVLQSAFAVNIMLFATTLYIVIMCILVGNVVVEMLGEISHA